MPLSSSHPIHAFGEFELDALRRLLTNRLDAKPVDITGRVMDALLYFVERPGQLIDKKALMDALWPSVVVEEGNLTQTIHTLRKTLGEKPDAHRYIVTVPGRGYKFVAPVTTRDANDVAAANDVADSEPAPTNPPQRSQWNFAVIPFLLILLVVFGAVIGALVARNVVPPEQTTVVAPTSIAVLPFVDMSAEQDQTYFADGLSEEILNLLAHANDLRVIARTSSFSFRGEKVDIKTIATRLDVSHVLEGSVRKTQGRLRITAKLIDATTSAQVWSDTYDRDINDVFGVQSEIATAVADALRVTLASAAPRRAETTSAAAYDHYLLGRHLFNRRAPNDVPLAKEHFEAAVRIDPNYGHAWAALAGVFYVSLYSDTAWPYTMKEWGEAAERGVALAPDLAEANMRAGQYELYDGKPDEGHAHFARAFALDPNDTLVLGTRMSHALVEGRMEEVVALQSRIVAIDPLSASRRSDLGLYLIAVGRLPEAEAELERSLELSPAAQETMLAVVDLLLMQGSPDKALAAAAHLSDGYRRDGRLALIAYANGSVRDGDEILARLTALTKNPDFDPGVALAIAQVYAAKREPDRAFEWLSRAPPRTARQLELRSHWALLEDVHATPHFKSLHADPRWAAFVAQLRAQLETS